MDHPDIPYLPTVRLMLLARYFARYQEKAERFRVLNLGMGGASVERFFARLMPDTTVHAVEVNPALITAMQEFFLVPAEEGDRGLAIFAMEAERFLKQQLDNAGADYNMIVVDHLTKSEPADVLSHCEYAAPLLAADGCLAINLIPDSDEQLRDHLLAIRQYFPCVRIAGLPGYRNVVVFARLQPFETVQVSRETQGGLFNPKEEHTWLESLLVLPDKAVR